MMNILGIDSSGLVASVALQSDDKLVGEYTIHNKKTHSQTLLPMIHDMLEMADVSVKELDAIAIASGPGSFTGLRIGAATAKGLACLQSCRCRGFGLPNYGCKKAAGVLWHL